MPNIVRPELLWIVLVLITIAAHGYGVLDAARDVWALKLARTNGRLRFAAQGHIVMSTILGLVQCRELYFGILVALTPSQPSTRTTEEVLFTVAIIFAGQLGLLLVAVGAIWFRHRLRHMERIR